jgi:hypothetical protein
MSIQLSRSTKHSDAFRDGVGALESCWPCLNSLHDNHVAFDCFLPLTSAHAVHSPDGQAARNPFSGWRKDLLLRRPTVCGACWRHRHSTLSTFSKFLVAASPSSTTKTDHSTPLRSLDRTISRLSTLPALFYLPNSRPCVSPSRALDTILADSISQREVTASPVRRLKQDSLVTHHHLLSQQPWM